MSGPKSPPNADLNVRLRLPKSAGAGLALAAAIWSLVPSLSLAQGQTPRQNLGEARFHSEDGAAFILDRSQGPVLFRFEASHEVWVLTPRRVGRGDLIYLDDAGQPLLRATKLGGMTVFTPETPTGSAAALAGRAPPIRTLSALSPTGLLQKLTLASAKASRAVQKLVTFDAEDVTTDSAPLFADSALTAAEAFVQMARRADSRAKAIQIDRVLLIQGDNSDARRQGSQIVITIVPDDGVAGRPSSAKVAKAIAR